MVYGDFKAVSSGEIIQKRSKELADITEERNRYKEEAEKKSKVIEHLHEQISDLLREVQRLKEFEPKEPVTPATEKKK